MGPRPFSRGNACPRSGSDVRRAASMGPRPFSRGNSVAGDDGSARRAALQWGHGLSAVEISAGRLARRPLDPASMGPRPFSRGNPADSAGPISKSRSFNGATAFQPWKLAFQGPESFEIARFNGATAFQPWKCCAIRRWPAIRTGLQWGHGLSAVEMSMRPGCWCTRFGFNGATAFQPWKCLPRQLLRNPRGSFNGATAFQPWK